MQARDVITQLEATDARQPACLPVSVPADPEYSYAQYLLDLKCELTTIRRPIVFLTNWPDTVARKDLADMMHLLNTCGVTLIYLMVGDKSAAYLNVLLMRMRNVLHNVDASRRPHLLLVRENRKPNDDLWFYSFFHCHYLGGNRKVVNVPVSLLVDNDHDKMLQYYYACLLTRRKPWKVVLHSWPRNPLSKYDIGYLMQCLKASNAQLVSLRLPIANQHYINELYRNIAYAARKYHYKPTITLRCHPMLAQRWCGKFFDIRAKQRPAKLQHTSESSLSHFSVLNSVKSPVRRRSNSLNAITANSKGLSAVVKTQYPSYP